MLKVFDEWKITEDKFEISQNYKNESIFTVANGNIGLRGDFEEGLGEDSESLGFMGNYINGFYDTEVIKYGEHAYGYAKHSQTMLNVCSAKGVRLLLEDGEFLLTKGQVVEYLRELYMKEGILQREIRWCSEKGREVIISVNRLASFNDIDIALIEYSVESVNFEGALTLITVLDGDVTNRTRSSDPRVGSGLKGKVLKTEKIYTDITEDGVKYSGIVQCTKNTGFLYACAAANQIESGCTYVIEYAEEENQISNRYSFKVSPGDKIKLKIYISYHTSIDTPKEMLKEKAVSSAIAEYKKGTGRIKQEQKKYLEGFWNYADIEIKGKMASEVGYREKAYDYFVKTARADLDDTHNNTKDGLNMVNMAGTWCCIVNGFGGMRINDDEIIFKPYLPGKWKSYRFRVLFKNKLLEVEVGRETVSYRLIEGDEMDICHNGNKVKLTLNMHETLQEVH